MYLDLRELAGEKSRLLSKYGKYVNEGDVVFPEGADDELNESLLRLEDLLELESQLFNCDMQEYAKNEGTLIPEDDFSDYCESFAYDMGMVEKNSAITLYIMWDSWEQSMREGFNEVTFDGDTYLLRSY